MLSATGKINGKDYNNEPVPASELAEHFGIPKPNGNQLTFESVTYRLDQFGQPVVQRSIEIPTFISGFDQRTSASVSIRYYESSTQNEKGVTVYSPRSISILGAQKVTMPDEAYEKFIILYLSKICETSPFGSTSPLIRFYDQAKVTAIAEASASLITETIKAVSEAPDERIMKFAMANGYPTGTAAQTRVALMTAVSQNPLAFSNKWHDVGSTIRGTIMFALDKGIISQGRQNGNPAWVWAASSEVICKIADQGNPVLSLENYFSQSNTAFADLESRIASKETSVAHVDSTGEIVKEAFMSGKLFLDRKTRRVLYMIDEDPKNGKLVINVESNDTYITEVTNYFKSEAGSQDIGLLK